MASIPMKRKVEDAGSHLSNGQTKKRAVADHDAPLYFRNGLFDSTTLGDYTRQYAKSRPFKYGVIKDLLQPALLRSVRDEIRANISFTPKETDIYKIHQSGDLANLDGLDDESLKLLPSLVTLRDALYSAPFRDYLAHITGSGPLSGSKTDMAVNVYTPTCHLLCHDDVIGSRRVSYILYLTDPDRPWRAEWGGALRLYPTETVQDGSQTKVPYSSWSQSIPPAFNQLSFFAVQPGESFHDVEEVYARTADDKDDDSDGGRIRLAISGWYHIPQPGEDGYEQGAEERQAEKSSLAQLQGDANKYDLPQSQWISHDEIIPATDDEDASQLTEADLNFLLRFMNPRYLTPETVEELSDTFSEDSSLRLAMFFSDKFALSLRQQLESLDAGKQPTRKWTTARPPHKHRYRYLQPKPRAPPSAKGEQPSLPLHEVLDELFPSLAFRKWLSLATDLTLDDCDVLARRFRRGLDYTLATGYSQRDPQLEVCLGMTPTRGWGSGGADDDAADSPDPYAQDDPAAENVGGYEVYMAGDDEVENGAAEANADASQAAAVASTNTGAGHRGRKRKPAVDPAVYTGGGGDDDDDDGILLSLTPGWNVLSVVLRDRGTLRFVKYVSQSAPGDRWDVFGVWKVDGDLGYDDDDDEDDEDNGDDDDNVDVGGRDGIGNGNGNGNGLAEESMEVD